MTSSSEVVIARVYILSKVAALGNLLVKVARSLIICKAMGMELLSDKKGINRPWPRGDIKMLDISHSVRRFLKCLAFLFISSSLLCQVWSLLTLAHVNVQT